MQRDLVCIVDEDDQSRSFLGEACSALDVDVLMFAAADAFLQSRDALTRAVCVVLSATLRGITGIDLQTSLTLIGNRATILFVSGPCEAGIAVRALRAGATDFLIRPVTADVLRDRLAEAISLFHARQARRARLHAIAQNLNALTPRERQVLHKVVDGCANAAIALDLKISLKTVEQHRARAMDKMRAGSLAELVAQVTEWRLLTDPALAPGSRIARG